ncbi:nuclear pore complex protein Nup153 isoform X4 [Tenrec ecaudatus]|uniref:nuclear pore complex protein Nup153 isoform X4 n=1 Tax=Tenrec ecaudatus TaxID=94439 RepID=UPI003F5A94AD
MASGAGGVGGGGGGGKIRTRRCHQGPVKPYAQGRQQHQQGILSRVTESVKNIVPGWLQRYFNKNEDVCSCSADTNEVPPWPENREEDRLLYAEEESAHVNDGRITPEPTASNTEEPSTTSSASNYPNVLTRPSLHRSHLNFSLLDSSALHCQPSTSSAFPIGSSGFSLVKEIKDSTSQHDDDNISTTSGFSSRASDKDIAVSKNTSVPPLWSPEAERSHSLPQHTATSSKKPAFNLSAFGALSPSLGNSSILKTSQLGDSPFYPGKTTYGGAAAAARQSKPRNTPYQAPVRRQMKAKQLNAQSYGVTSSTARRILQSLEKMSSPLADAKRIPSVVSSSLNSPLHKSGIDITDFQTKREKVDSQYPPVQRLMTPKPVSIATNRTVYFKPSLTPSGEMKKTNQRIDKKHNTGFENNVAPRQARERESGFSYPNFSVPAANGLSSGGGGGKMRRERTRFVASKPPEEEEMEVPELPKISLPITSSSLPTFNFSSPTAATSSPSPISPSQSLTKKVQMTSPSSAASPMFRFSSPIVKSTEADVLPPSSIGFTFSVPLAKTTELSSSSSTFEPITSSSVQDNASVNSTSCTKKQDEDCEGPFRPAKVLKEGSVLEILKSPGSSVPTSSSSTTPASVSPGGSLGLEKFKKPEGSWDCEACLVLNKAESTTCVACENAKPGTKSEFKGLATSSSSNTAATFTFGIPPSTSGPSQMLTSTGNFKFGNQGGFKIGVSSDSDSINPTSGGGFKFSKPTGDFKFGVSSDPKPEEDKKDSKNDHNFKFGLSSSVSTPAPLAPFPFGASSLGQQEKKEELPKSSSAGFSFGTSVINPTPTAPNTAVTSENKSGFGFGTTETKSGPVAPFTCKTVEAKKEDTPTTKLGFTFGSLPSASMFALGRTEEKQQEPDTSTSLVFGKKADNEEPKCPPVFSFGNSEQTKEESSSKLTFGFGLVQPAEKESEQPAKATFAFGAQGSTTADPGAAKPVFSFLNNNSSTISTPTTSAGGVMFGSSTSSSNPPVAAFVFGQASNPVSSSAFGNSAESNTSQVLLFSQESKPATTSSTAAAVTPFVFGPGASSSTTAATGFSFGATTTSSSSGSSFVFGTGPSSTPSASPAFGASQTPTFGQSQGASQPNPSGFGSISSSTALFPAAAQPAPTFGTVSSSSQPPVFGQQPSQSAFGSGAAPNSSSVFQFGSSTTNFNFTNNNPSGVFTFGANPGAPAASAQPSGSGGFPFSQPSAGFTVGSNGKNLFSSSGPSVSGRKIKTAVRRRK